MNQLLCILFFITLLVGCKSDDDSSPIESLTDQEIVAQYLTIDMGNPDNFTLIDYPDYYTQAIREVTNEPDSNLVSDKGAQLGRVLFYDVNLSRNNTVSCSSCHNQENGFTDEAQFSSGFENGLTGAHSMRLLNIKFYVPGSMFWDKRAETLEDQSIMPIQDAIEMGFDMNHGGMEAVIEKLESLPYYPILFNQAFGTSEVTVDKIQKALGQFLRSIVSINSKFDEGHAKTFNPNLPGFGVDRNFHNYNEIENFGKQLFLDSKYPGAPKCADCHRPPTFALAFESMSNGLDSDETIVFKTPSLKSSAMASHYMHDGRFVTLEEVIDHYSSGIQSSPATDILLMDDQGNPHQLNFTSEEKDALIAFIHTLDDTQVSQDSKFSSPFK